MKTYTKIQMIQTDTHGAVEAIGQIGTIISKINDCPRRSGNSLRR